MVFKKEGVADKTANVAGPPLEALLDALPDAVICFERNYHILYASQSAQSLFEKGLFGKDLRAFFDKDSTVPDAIKTMFGSGGTISLHDVRVMDRTALTLSLVPVTDTDFFAMSIHLQPQQINAEWAEKARQALKPAQLMARMLVHEIKNPLAGIRAAAQLLDTGKTNADDRELLGLIIRETDRLSRLVEKVNIFEDATPENNTGINIHEVLQSVVQLSRTSHPHVTVEEKYDPSLPDVQGHFDHLTQAILNIVKNAAEANAACITIHTFYDTTAVYHPVTHAKLPFCIDIEDNGPGMDKETQGRIFEPYFTTKPQGEGLGLAIVSKIIDDHGGIIDLASQDGKTVFKIRLPMVKS